MGGVDSAALERLRSLLDQVHRRLGVDHVGEGRIDDLQQEGAGVGEEDEVAVDGVAEQSARLKFCRSDGCTARLSAENKRAERRLHLLMIFSALSKHSAEYCESSFIESGRLRACCIAKERRKRR